MEAPSGELDPIWQTLMLLARGLADEADSTAQTAPEQRVTWRGPNIERDLLARLDQNCQAIQQAASACRRHTYQQLVEQGWSVQQIADHWGVTVGAIYKVLARKPAREPRPTDTRGRRMLGTVLAAALERVLDLDGQIPWSTVRLPVARSQLKLILRSKQTVREMINEMSPDLQARRLENCMVYSIALDEPEEIIWTVPRPSPDSEWYRNMSFDEWIAYQASELPEGYLPSRPLYDKSGKSLLKLSKAERVERARWHGDDV